MTTERVAWFERSKSQRQVRRPRPPAPPKQAEIGGIETCDAAELLMKDQRRRQAKASKPKPEDTFDFDLRRFGLPRFERHHLFAKQALGRKWEFDHASLQYMLAVEIEGIVVQWAWIAQKDEGGRIVRCERELIVRGRHASVGGFNEDCEKYASAAMLGWTVIRFTPKQVEDGTAIDYTQRVLAAKGWKR